MPAIVDRALGGIGRLCDTARDRRRRTPGYVVVGLTAAVAVITTAMTIRGYGLADLHLYRDAVRSWTAGGELYAYRSVPGNLGFPLPPASAFLLLPVAALPPTPAGWLIVLGGWAALVLALATLVGPVARRYGRRRRLTVCVAAALAAATEPVRAAVGLGTLDLLLLGLVTADVVALRRARSRTTWAPARPRRAITVRNPARSGIVRGDRFTGAPATRGRTLGAWLTDTWATGAWAGMGIGLATGIGVSPVIFIGYLAVTRQWRAARTAAGTALVVASIAFLLAPRQTGAWFTEVLWRLDRTGPVDATANQSLAGTLARLYDSTTTPVLLWLSFAMLVLAVGLIRAKSAHADGDEVAGFTLTGLTGAAIGPVTGTHELMWVLPALLILLDTAASRHGAARRTGPALRRLPRRLAGAGYACAAAASYLLFVAAPVWTYEHRLPETSHHADGLIGALGENAFGLALIVMVTALPWRHGSAPVNLLHRSGTAVRRPIPPARRPLQPRDS